MIPSDQIICSIDTETTGVNTETDRIVTLSVYKRNAENEQSKHWTVNPGIPIPKSSYEIHGITDENVRDCPDFGKIANEFLDFIGSCPLVGFNIYAFDILIIMAELTRHGIDRVFPGEDVLIIDCGNIFKKKEPRTLEAAVQKYCGRKHEDAHSSLADAEATAAVLHGQLRQYEDLAQCRFKTWLNSPSMMIWWISLASSAKTAKVKSSIASANRAVFA